MFAVHEEPFYRHGFFLIFEAAGVIGGASASLALTGIAYAAGERVGKPASYAGVQMPSDGTTLSGAEDQTLVDWITQGALND